LKRRKERLQEEGERCRRVSLLEWRGDFKRRESEGQLRREKERERERERERE